MRLYRQRLMPDELVPLVNDEIVLADDDVIVTKWRTLKERADFSHGSSCYFLGKGYKVSKFFTKDNELLYYYCDVVEHERDGMDYVFTDLLFDVTVYPNGEVRVLDLAEGAEALAGGIISQDQMCAALERLDRLLGIIYGGGMPDLTRYIDGLWGEVG